MNAEAATAQSLKMHVASAVDLEKGLVDVTIQFVTNVAFAVETVQASADVSPQKLKMFVAFVVEKVLTNVDFVPVILNTVKVRTNVESVLEILNTAVDIVTIVSVFLTELM